MRRASNFITVAALLVILGCVVIPDTFEAHITIDIRHVEEQADHVLDYVEGKTETIEEVKVPAPQSMLRRTIDFLSPIRVAYAAEQDSEMKDTSPLITQIADSMKKRFPEVEALKKTGAVGENNRGLLELVKPDALENDDARNAAQRTISADNEDRKALYKEVARINSEQSLKVATVERVYAQKRLERAKPGELFQLPPAGADFDAFAASTPGKKLGGACRADAWVTIK